MSYTPTHWQTGDTITAEKLNNMEQGIADASSGGDSKIEIFDMYDYYDAEDTAQYVIYATKAQLSAASVAGKICYARMASTMGRQYGFSDFPIISFYDNPESGTGDFSIDILKYSYDDSMFMKVVLEGDSTHIYPSTDGQYIDPSLSGD